jgi:hypothetical protein
MRAVNLSALLFVLGSQIANAGDVRHSRFPESVVGIWATSAEMCGASDTGTSRFVITAGKIVDSKLECAVEYVVETAAPRGPIYSAHGYCTDKTQSAEKSILNLVVQPRSDSQISIGLTLGSLADYQRCPQSQ